MVSIWPVRRRGLLALVLVALTAAVFQGVRQHDFVRYDDHVYVSENPQLRAGLGRTSLAAAFRPYFTNWIPLTALSLQLDHALYGFEPRGYLLTNLALHAASVVLLLLGLSRLTGAVGRSAFATAVFAVHPLHVESVAWVSERKDVLSGLFFMLTLCAYARYAERPGSRGRYAVVLLALALGLLAKPMLVTLPCVLLLLDFWPLGRLAAPAQRRRALVEKLPLLALSAAVGVVALRVQQSAGTVASTESVPLAARLANACESAVVYAAQSLWPSGLAAIYPHPLAEVSSARGLACGALLAVATGVAFRERVRHPWWIVGWLWYLGMLVPVIGLVQVGLQARADRYTYLPQVGLSLALAWGAFDLLGGSPRGRRALAAAGAAAVVALAVLAERQVRSWRNTETLFTRALAVTRDNYLAHDGLAAWLLREGRLDEAERQYALALRAKPGWMEPALGLGDVALRRGHPERALALYRPWLAIAPESERLQEALGFALLETGEPEQAEPHLRFALAARPEDAQLHAALGMLAERTGRPAEAVEHAREALRLDPGLLPVANNLAWLLATTSDAQLRDPGEALRLASASLAGAGEAEPAYLDTLAASYAAAGRFAEAVDAAERGAALAEQRGDAKLASALRDHLALYRDGRALGAP
jgi:tetratricopeptide (TPR) repeat protein